MKALVIIAAALVFLVIAGDGAPIHWFDFNVGHWHMPHWVYQPFAAAGDVIGAVVGIIVAIVAMVAAGILLGGIGLIVVVSVLGAIALALIPIALPVLLPLVAIAILVYCLNRNSESSGSAA